MPIHALRLRVATVALLGLALTVGCSRDNNEGSPTQKLLGVSGPGVALQAGLALSADPMAVVIDPDDPSAPTDPNRGNERYATVGLNAVATDELGTPQPDLDLTFGATAGVLASGGAAVKTDAQGRATDSLRVYQSDPDAVEVSVTDGTRIVKFVVTKTVLAAPVAKAGRDLVVECIGNGSARVRLDGSASSDPNGDITLYEWFEHYGTPEQVLLGTGAILGVVLPVGDHVLTLRVTDATDRTSTDEVIVQVVDTAAPRVELTVTPSSLWPPNHQMVRVHATLRVQECGPYTVSLVRVVSNEPDNGLGDGDTSDDIQGVSIGEADYDFALRAERAGGGSGRVYTIVYRVVDEGGRETLARALVTVPHDQSGR